MASIKNAIKRFIPRPILAIYGRERLRLDMAKSRERSRQDIFSDIYESNRWGGKSGTYDSGSGSRPDVTGSYISVLQELIRREGVKRIVDLGCGDFEVGRRLLLPEVTYIGCDVVPGLIARNSAKYGNERVQFSNLDMVTAPLPMGDLCIIRQVFQHLSNGDILAVLQKTRQYPLLVVTDEQVEGDRSKDNIDILPYHGTRRLFGRGLKLEAAPFFQHIETLLEHPSGFEDSTVPRTYLRSVLVRHDAAKEKSL